MEDNLSDEQADVCTATELCERNIARAYRRMSPEDRARIVTIVRECVKQLEWDARVVAERPALFVEVRRTSETDFMRGAPPQRTVAHLHGYAAVLNHRFARRGFHTVLVRIRGRDEWSLRVGLVPI
ncbi:MAG: hypothetical protein WC732_09660 [Candidatus Omnitrophota bacterium]